jgi:hypothetical protein
MRDERRKLWSRLAKLDRTIAKLSPRNGRAKIPSPAAIDQWLDELSAGLPDLPPLPTDFSRSDLYDDHD